MPAQSVIGAWLNPAPNAGGIPTRICVNLFLQDLPDNFLAKYYQVLLGNDISRKSFPANNPPGSLGGQAYLID
jgi:hypothetical protein